ncbi:iron complex transport system substrate-binding protein [Scopulibacillus daqui]|uniref:Iron complex transport system substrate-binding protein n=1 Tax=Scopulibacillus daqui TaxID=1469162 RepID=A0ABS2PXD8_9BACL|nr:iron-hydroxamate ABC transporter substrate-binding protein [Scopulibacillus daqui]MBM7644526.1 iron complex transport system substrate-binding protein [Scopulibacillus daqui]
MKKTMSLSLFLLVLAFLLAACGSHQSSDTKEQSKKSQKEEQTTKVYQSENGPVKVPKHPKRVVLLSSYFAGDVASLGVNIVGVDKWGKTSPVLKDKLKNAKVVSDQDLEEIIDLHPDLIIGLSNTKNIDKLKQIAPTVTYTYGKLNYLDQYTAIGELLGKEKEAKKWVEDFKQRSEALGKKIKAKIGEDATVSVIEKFDKQFYVYGDNWARGTEILYQAMGLKMPKKVKETALKKGYQAISPEAIPEFAGDYIVLVQEPGKSNSFEQTKTYKNIPAVKNGRVIKVNAKAFDFNDPLSLDYELKVFEKAFLDKK